MKRPVRKARNLVMVLGDQLDRDSSAFDGFDPAADVVWMAEVSEESEYVWSHKARIVVFLSAMRHFRDLLKQESISVDYRLLDDKRNRGSFSTELAEAAGRLRPQRLIVVEPGEWRVKESLTATARQLGIELEVRPDRHFLCTHEQFAEHAEGRKDLRLEFFYREMRRRLNVLVEGSRPVGGIWNYDRENRKSFGKEGPGRIPRPVSFPPDETTREVIALVNKTFPDHPGKLDKFDWPVTGKQAAQALKDFIDNRLPLFGPYEDAMWTGEPYVYHSRLSSSLNLHLLDPRDACAAAVKAYNEGRAPLNSAEGFVRQVIGWREFIRGIYWRFMPDYAHMNEFRAELPLPGFYWTGETDMNCLRQVIGQTLEYGFAHHIQRLMVTGLFAQLLGVDPHEVHRWYLAIYVDAVEWVELPNVLGMSQFADGGLMATKPYAATGKYIKRMSNYCDHCRYDPAEAVGEDACPFTTLYWDFLMRNQKVLRRSRRMSLQLRNIDRLDTDTRKAILRGADELQSELTAAARVY